MTKEPTLITGALLALLAGITTLIGAGSLADGFQFNPDGWIVLGPVLTALGIRLNPDVWSQATVDDLAPIETQRKVLSQKRH